MLNFRIFSDMNIRPMSRTIEYKGKIFITYFVDAQLALITSKIRLGILTTIFRSWTEGIFSRASKIAFQGSEIA